MNPSAVSSLLPWTSAPLSLQDHMKQDDGWCHHMSNTVPSAELLQLCMPEVHVLVTDNGTAFTSICTGEHCTIICDMSQVGHELQRCIASSPLLLEKGSIIVYYQPLWVGINHEQDLGRSQQSAHGSWTRGILANLKCVMVPRVETFDAFGNRCMYGHEVPGLHQYLATRCSCMLDLSFLSYLDEIRFAILRCLPVPEMVR